MTEPETPQEVPAPGDAAHDSPVRFPGDTPETRALYAAIPERNTADVILRTTQQHHVSLSSMADTKASIIITVSSIVLTISLGRMNDPSLRACMLTLIGFTLAALLLAILAVLPKYRPLRLRPGQALPPQFNVLFFGHFAELDQQRFLQESRIACRLMARFTEPWPATFIRSAATSRTTSTATCA